MKAADRLTSQLYHLPEIVGRLGLSVASAQKALNADYLDSLKLLTDQVIRLQKATDDKSKDLVLSLIKTLAPSRYQFTETTIEFSADLSETFNAAASASLGVGIGAMTLNAGLAIGFGYDYRAAARIRSVLHAIPIDTDTPGKLLERAEKMDAGALALPPRSDVDATVTNQSADLVASWTGNPVAKVSPGKVETDLEAAEAAAAEAAKQAKIASETKKEYDGPPAPPAEKVGEIKKRNNAAVAAATKAADEALSLLKQVKEAKDVALSDKDKAKDLEDRATRAKADASQSKI